MLLVNSEIHIIIIIIILSGVGIFIWDIRGLFRNLFVTRLALLRFYTSVTYKSFKLPAELSSITSL